MAKLHNAIAILAILVIFSAVAPSDEPVRIWSGTVLVWRYLPSQILVAADSRLSANDPTVKPEDRGCKIIALSKTELFFFAGGSAEFNSGTTSLGLFTANQLARRAHRESSGLDPSERIRATAERWAELMKNNLDRIIAISPSSVWSAERASVGGFGGLETGGAPLLYTVDIGITIRNPKPATVAYDLKKKDPYSNHVMGFTGTGGPFAEEFLNNATPRAREAHSALTKSLAKFLTRTVASKNCAPRFKPALIGVRIVQWEER